MYILLSTIAYVFSSFFAIYKLFFYCLIHFTQNSILNLTHVRLYNFYVYSSRGMVRYL